MSRRSKQPHESDPNQGAFIAAEMVGNGSTDPQNFGRTGQITGVVPEGFFLDEAPLTTENAVAPEVHVAELALAAAATHNRREGQRGKHSPLQRDGTYEAVKPGDVLPGFGIVTYSNLDDANQHARGLEAKRKAAVAAKPGLNLGHRGGLREIIDSTANALSMNKPDKQKPKPPTNPTKRRMAVGRLFGREATRRLLENHGDFSELTDEVLRAVEPSTLFRSLVGDEVVVRKGVYGKQAVYYSDPKGIKRKVALSSAEKALLPGDIVAYAGSAATKAANGSKQRLMNNPDPDAPTRAVVHVLDRKLDELETYIKKTLAARSELLDKFMEALQPKNRGSARFGSEFAMRSAEAVVMDTMVSEMLNAVADQRGWSAVELYTAKLAVLFRLHAPREDNAHLQYADKLCRMLEGYNRVKIVAFADRVEQGKVSREEHMARLLPA